MTEGYRVDLPALDRLIRTLEEGAERVREANAELGGYASTEALNDAGGGIDFNIDAEFERLEVLGNETLAHAAKRFATKWRYGLDKLDEAAEEVLDRLHDTRNAYQALEDAYREMFDQVLADPGGVAPGAATLPGIANALGGQS